MDVVDEREPLVGENLGVVACARIDGHADVERAGQRRPDAGHQRADGVAATLVEALVWLYVQYERANTRRLAGLGYDARFAVNVQAARHAPGVELQPVLLQPRDPAPDRRWTVNRHPGFVVVAGHPVRAVAGLDENLADGRRIPPDRTRQVVDGRFGHGLPLVVPDRDLVVIRGDDCHRQLL